MTAATHCALAALETYTAQADPANANGDATNIADLIADLALLADEIGDGAAAALAAAEKYHREEAGRG